MNVDELQAQAVRLPLKQRGDLVSKLISSLGAPSFDDEEVMERVEQLESGEVKDISHDALISRLKHVPKS
jgi:hypothetical protein